MLRDELMRYGIVGSCVFAALLHPKAQIVWNRFPPLAGKFRETSNAGALRDSPPQSYRVGGLINAALHLSRPWEEAF